MYYAMHLRTVLHLKQALTAAHDRPIAEQSQFWQSVLITRFQLLTKRPFPSIIIFHHTIITTTHDYSCSSKLFLYAIENKFVKSL